MIAIKKPNNTSTMWTIDSYSTISKVIEKHPYIPGRFGTSINGVYMCVSAVCKEKHQTSEAITPRILSRIDRQKKINRSSWRTFFY